MTPQLQRGQAMTEYVVVLLFVVVALVAAAHPSSPVRDLVAAVKQAWAAYPMRSR